MWNVYVLHLILGSISYRITNNIEKRKVWYSLLTSLAFLFYFTFPGKISAESVLISYYCISLSFTEDFTMILHHLLSLWFLTFGYEQRVIIACVILKIGDIPMYLGKLTDKWFIWILSMVFWVIFRVIMPFALYPFIIPLNNVLGVSLHIANVFWLKKLYYRLEKSLIHVLEY